MVWIIGTRNGLFSRKIYQIQRHEIGPEYEADFSIEEYEKLRDLYKTVPLFHRLIRAKIDSAKDSLGKVELSEAGHIARVFWQGKIEGYEEILNSPKFANDEINQIMESQRIEQLGEDE